MRPSGLSRFRPVVRPFHTSSPTSCLPTCLVSALRAKTWYASWRPSSLSSASLDRGPEGLRGVLQPAPLSLPDAGTSPGTLVPPGCLALGSRRCGTSSRSGHFVSRLYASPSSNSSAGRPIQSPHRMREPTGRIRHRHRFIYYLIKHLLLLVTFRTVCSV